MYKGQTVAVVIPAYNEEGLVGDVIETVPEFVDRIYVVDDASPDGTWDEIRRSALRINDEIPPTPVFDERDGDDVFSMRVVPIRHEENRGVGAAIKTGYRRAHADGIDVTAVMNGDGQMDPDILDRIVDPIVTGQAEYVKGNRLIHPEFRAEMSAWRTFGNALLSVLTKVASGYWKTSDPQNGYTAISYNAIDCLDLDSLYDRFGFLNHLLVHCNLRELPITDVAMPARYGDETSNIRYSTFVPSLSLLLLRSFLGRLRYRYIAIDFHPLVVLYGLGVIGISAAIVSTVSVLMGIGGSTPGLVSAVAILVTFILGGLALTFASIYDMEQSVQLEGRRYGLGDDDAQVLEPTRQRRDDGQEAGATRHPSDDGQLGSRRQ